MSAVEFLRDCLHFPGRRVIVGILGSGDRDLDGYTIPQENSELCAQKEKLGFIVVVDKEQRNKLLTNL